MKTNGKHDHPPLQNDCRHTRLAESSVAAVDVCACGMMQLHIGALTLRMAPCAISELLATLGEAVAQHTAARARSDADGVVVPFVSSGRGEA